MNESLTIFIDGWCGFCTRNAKWIKKFDIHNKIIIKDIRIESSEFIDIEVARKQMASIDQNQQISYGFDSIYKIAKRLPMLWLLVPFLFLLKILHLGDFLYNELAIRRKIIALHCDENCELKQS